MEDLTKVDEMTPEEVKNLDLNKIEYIALSSGKIIYIKKEAEKEESQKEEDLKEIPQKEKEEFEATKRNSGTKGKRKK